MRYNVTTLIVDQRPSGIDDEVLSNRHAHHHTLRSATLRPSAGIAGALSAACWPAWRPNSNA
jgi:hypothetical protein